MKNLKNVNFSQEILKGSIKLDYKSSIFDTYLLRNGKIFRMLRDSKNFSDMLAKVICKDYPAFFQNELERKLVAVSECSVEEIIKTDEIIRNKDGSIKGYSYSLPKYPDFNKVLNKNKDNIPALIYQLNQVIEECHQQGIRLPNLGTLNFMHYNDKTGQIYIAPCDLLQIGDIPSYDRSDLLDIKSNSVFSQPAFHDKSYMLVSDNFDKAALYIMMLNAFLGMNVPKELRKRYSASVKRYNPNPCFINPNPTADDREYFGHSYYDLNVAIDGFVNSTRLAGTVIDSDLLRIYSDYKKGFLASLRLKDRVPSPERAAKKLAKLNKQGQLRVIKY